VKAYPAETTEAFLDGHVSALEFFGSVPLSILYDLKIAGARICGMANASVRGRSSNWSATTGLRYRAVRAVKVGLWRVTLVAIMQQV
jgi:hypothetical protein